MPAGGRNCWWHAAHACTPCSLLVQHRVLDHPSEHARRDVHHEGGQAPQEPVEKEEVPSADALARPRTAAAAGKERVTERQYVRSAVRRPFGNTHGCSGVLARPRIYREISCRRYRHPPTHTRTQKLPTRDTRTTHTAHTRVCTHTPTRVHTHTLDTRTTHTAHLRRSPVVVQLFHARVALEAMRRPRLPQHVAVGALRQPL